MKVIAFRLFGDFAHFRPYYTTSSPTTYTLMPPTSIIGLLGSILGLEKNENEYYRVLTEDNTKVGINLEVPTTKIHMGTNLINTKGNYWVPTRRNSSGPRTPTRYEYLRCPEYLIYVSMDNKNRLDELSERLRTHSPAYTVSLGLSNLLADFEFISYEEAVYTNSNEYKKFDSAIPLTALQKHNAIELSPDTKYCKEQYVKYFIGDRIPAEYVDVLFASNGKQISVKTEGYYEMGDRRFLFLND